MAKLFAAIGALLLAVGLIRLCLRDLRSRRAALLLGLYFAVPVIAIWWLSQSRPVFLARYLITALAPFQVIIAVGLVSFTSIARRRVGQIGRIVLPAALVCIAAITAIGVVDSVRNYLVEAQDYGRSQFEGTYEAMQQYSGGLPPNQVRWAVTSPDYYFSCALHTSHYAVIPYRPNNLAAAEQVVGEYAETGVRRVVAVIVSDPWWDGQHEAPAALQKEYTLIAKGWTGTWPLLVYSRAVPEELQEIGAAFTNGIMLAAASIYPDERAQLLEVNLEWRNNSHNLTGDEKVFIHVSNVQSPDQIVTQLDVPLAVNDPSRSVQTYAVPLPRTLPAGAYEVTVGLYHGSWPDIPRIKLNDGSDKVGLGQFTLP